jgi:hypothetical protein
MNQNPMQIPPFLLSVLAGQWGTTVGILKIISKKIYKAIPRSAASG